ncbi:MAG: hypothetical protein R3C19_10740 [Planctomycetaceae bacterium]
MTKQVQWSSRLMVPLALGMLIVVSGCGGGDAPKLAPVSGVVNFKGAPLAGAQVTFVPEGGPVAMGITDLEGKFKLKTGTMEGAMVGHCKASVNASAGSDGGDLAKPMTPEDMQAMAIAGTLEKAMKKQNQSLIPEKYKTAETSGLAYDVTAKGPNEFTLDLQ